jgi:hypothetical protein
MTTISTGCYIFCSTFRYLPPNCLIEGLLANMIPVADSIILLFERTGKVPALCATGGTFEYQFSECQSCLAANGATVVNSSAYSAYSYLQEIYVNAVSFCAGTEPGAGAQTEIATTTITTGSFSNLQPSSSDTSITPSSSAMPSSFATSSSSATTFSSCPPYPSFSFSSISSGNASSIAPVSTVQSSSASPTSTYSFGFWLDYTYVQCPTRTINTVFTYPASCLPPNYLWGCPPGYLCTPPQVDCDLEVGPPSNDYVCTPSDCKPPPAIHTPAITAIQDVTNFSPYPLPTGYFNINPVLFGLDWGFFTANVSITSFASSPTITTIFTTRKFHKTRVSTILPSLSVSISNPQSLPAL